MVPTAQKISDQAEGAARQAAERLGPLADQTSDQVKQVAKRVSDRAEPLAEDVSKVLGLIKKIIRTD